MFSPHAFPGVQPGPQYDDNANKDLLVMVQIESRQGVENVEKIAAVPGLDALLIGKFPHMTCRSSDSRAWRRCIRIP